MKVKALLVKILVVCVSAAFCGAVVGVFFSLMYFGDFSLQMFAEAYLSDTPEKARLRFWIAFAVGAIYGIWWGIKVVKDLDF